MEVVETLVQDQEATSEVDLVSHMITVILQSWCGVEYSARIKKTQVDINRS